MADPTNTKPFPAVPLMTDFDIDEVISILMGVKPKPKRKSEKKKSSKNLKKTN